MPCPALLLSVALLSPPASGHAGASVAGVDVRHFDDGVVLYEGNFGLLLQGHDPGEPDRWDWICHEAITTPEALITPRYRRGVDGALWAVVPVLDQARDAGHAVYRSTDGGCAWEAVADLADLPALALEVAPDDPSHMLLGTDDPGGLWRSTDGGETWTAWLAPTEGRRFLDVELAASGALWAAARDADGTLVVAWSPDGSAPTVSTHAPPDVGSGAGDVTLSIATASPDAAGTAWLVAGPTTGDHLWRTDDGGASVTEVLTVINDVVDGVVTSDGAVWVAEGSRNLWRSTDGTTFDTVDGVPLGIGLGVDPRDGGTGVRFTSFAEFTNVLLSDVAADGSWSIALQPPDLDGPLTCRDGTDQREVCEPLWAEVEESIALYQRADTGDTGGGGSSDDGSTDEGGGGDTGAAGSTGCCSGGEAAGALLLGPLLLWGRRRRRA